MTRRRSVTEVANCSRTPTGVDQRHSSRQQSTPGPTSVQDQHLSNPILFPTLYLLQRRHGNAVEMILSRSSQDERQQKWHSDAEAYRAELQGLDDEDLEMAVDQELEKEALEHGEERAPYHRPQATADFTYWGQLPLWRLEEATALMFGKNPFYVTWAEIHICADVSLFAARYREVRLYLQRAAEAGQLKDPTSPAVFVAWMARSHMSSSA
jgi:hypothetical protein